MLSIEMHDLYRMSAFTPTIPRIPSQNADLLATRDQISAKFAKYLHRVLTPEQRGLAAI
ncbi:hypothetical protein A2U01_0069331, partial [Trifolium medium]|nr:hypothetical protein [Trifolium medium]